MTTARETATTAVEEAGAVAGTARDEAATVATTAAEQARTVAQTATQATSDVVSEAARQARDLVGETRQQVRTQAESQTQRLAENARSLAGQLTSMASNADAQGPATEIAHQLAGKVESLAGYLDAQSPEALMSDLRRYARQRPGLFLIGAGVAGFLAGRVVKGATAGEPDTQSFESAGAGLGTAAGNPVGGMELGAGVQTVTPGVPAFADPYPGDIAPGSGARTPGIGDGYGNG
jgi:hypothetical protein